MYSLIFPLMAYAQQTDAPDPNEVNETGQVVAGLGLSVTMLAGFILLIGIALTAILAVQWHRRRKARLGRSETDYSSRHTYPVGTR